MDFTFLNGETAFQIDICSFLSAFVIKTMGEKFKRREKHVGEQTLFFFFSKISFYANSALLIPGIAR